MKLTERTSGDMNQPGHVSSAMGENSLYNLAAPYLQNLDPQRTGAVISALRRLEILQREGIVVSMPEIVAQP